MAVIDETWTMTRGTIWDELQTDGKRLNAIGEQHNTVTAWDHRGRSEPPNEEDGELLESVPELLRKIRQLERELTEARDG